MDLPGLPLTSSDRVHDCSERPAAFKKDHMHRNTLCQKQHSSSYELEDRLLRLFSFMTDWTLQPTLSCYWKVKRRALQCRGKLVRVLTWKQRSIRNRSRTKFYCEAATERLMRLTPRLALPVIVHQKRFYKATGSAFEIFLLESFVCCNGCTTCSSVVFLTISVLQGAFVV